MMRAQVRGERSLFVQAPSEFCGKRGSVYCGKLFSAEKIPGRIIYSLIYCPNSPIAGEPAAASPVDQLCPSGQGPRRLQLLVQRHCRPQQHLHSGAEEGIPSGRPRQVASPPSLRKTPPVEGRLVTLASILPFVLSLFYLFVVKLSLAPSALMLRVQDHSDPGPRRAARPQRPQGGHPLRRLGHPPPHRRGRESQLPMTRPHSLPSDRPSPPKMMLREVQKDQEDRTPRLLCLLCALPMPPAFPFDRRCRA